MQITTVNIACVNKCTTVYIYTNVTAHKSIIRNSQNVGKLSVCANSGYQALFSDFSNQPSNHTQNLLQSMKKLRRTLGM